MIKNAKNGPFWRVFWKPEACGQTELPDRSVLIGQKFAENDKNWNATFWVIFKQCADIKINIREMTILDSFILDFSRIVFTETKL